MQAIQNTIARVRVGQPTTFENLAMFPILDDESREAPDYATLGEALEGDWVHISEVTEGGEVPQLKFVNDGDRAVLMMDGEELIGAKQNRVLNLTILAPAGKTLIIPVSCVEQGRWSSTSHLFALSRNALYAGARRMKTEQVHYRMAVGAGPTSDQCALWDEIAHKAERRECHSPTGAMEEIFRKDRADLEAYAAAFPAVDGQAGAIFAIGGRVTGLDLFEHPRILSRMLDKLVTSYALDALELADAPGQAPPVQEARRLLEGVGKARTRSYPSVGLGQDVHVRGSRVSGGALVLDDRLIHLSAYRADDEGSLRGGGGRFRMSSASRRRRGRRR